MAAITISEALGWAQVLKNRQAELIALRDRNSFHETRYIGANAEKSVERNPTYDCKKLDALVGQIAKEIRLLDAALKKTNATVNVVGYNQDDAVLGVIE